MNRAWSLWVAVLLAIAGVGVGQGGKVTWNPGYSGYVTPGQSQELTVEEQRKLGLSDAQILKIAEKRRALEKQRVELEKQLEAARDTANTANAQVAKLSQSVRDLTGDGLEAIYKEIMTPEQREAYHRQKFLEEARNWLQRYRWFQLTDAQVEDISNLLVPVFEKYSKMGDALKEERDELAELRIAEKLDIKAIEEAEKKVAELGKVNVWQQRDEELRDKMRAGLTPDQLDKLDKMYRRQQ